MLKFQERGVEFTMPNGRTGDPLVYVFNYRSGDTFLFDLGNTDRIPQKNLLKVQKVFVTHTHIDHFIGFDRLLRINIPHQRQLEFAGPTGIVANIEGKLAGYVWNLLEHHQLRFIVHEIASDQQIISYRLQFEDNGFKRSFYKNRCHDGIVSCFTDGAKIKATIVDHGIPVVSYRLCFPPKYKVQADKFANYGFSPGPWVKQLQTAISGGNHDQMIVIDNKEYLASWLATRILQSYPEFSVSYLTDLRFTWNNLQTVKQLHHKTGILFCESTFAECDHQRAAEKLHLTTKQCAMLAAYSEVRQLENFHFSSIYGRANPGQLRQEAVNHFNHYRRLNKDSLERDINAEIDNCRKFIR